jgi:hypothetical protein
VSQKLSKAELEALEDEHERFRGRFSFEHSFCRLLPFPSNYNKPKKKAEQMLGFFFGGPGPNSFTFYLRGNYSLEKYT